MKYIAIYARYSSDNQNHKSIDDQISECQKFIAENFETIVEPIVFSDSALSGQHTMHRTSYNSLVEAIRQGEISVIVSEGLDRLSRNLGDIANLYKIAKFKDTEIVTLQEGKISSLHIGFKGTMNDMFIDSLRHQVLRSQRNLAVEGKMFGLPYGYKIKLCDGREVKGEREIDQKKAVVVRLIYEMYANGHSLGSIVQILNARNIPSPRDSLWTKHSLMGSKARREGILCNEVYRGRVIWNMKSLRINPETGGKNYIMNPESEWVVSQREDLRIISDELWAKCDVQKWEPKNTLSKKRDFYLQNPLRSLVFCGACGSKKILADRKRYVCSAFKQHRKCTNARGTTYEIIINEAMNYLDQVLENFTSKKWLREFQDIVEKELMSKSSLYDEVAEIDQKTSRLVELIDEKDIKLEQLTDKLNEMQVRRSNLIVQISKSAPDMDMTVKKTLKKALEALHSKLLKTQEDDQNRVLLVALIKKIVLTPTQEYRGETIQIELNPDGWITFFRLIQQN